MGYLIDENLRLGAGKVLHKSSGVIVLQGQEREVEWEEEEEEEEEEAGGMHQ